ncbi:MAG: NAD(P)H-hydrate dehydratase [Bacteroidota bacterium]
MELLVDPDRMRELDRAAIRRFRIPGLVLMENAARSFVDILAGRFPLAVGTRALVVCGPGNNGGDGFAIARHLHNRGCEVEALLVGSRGAVSGDARVNLGTLLRLVAAGGGVRFSEAATGRDLRLRGRRPQLVVDALFGTGFAGRAEGLPGAAVHLMNRCGAYVASVDIASGVHAGTGRVAGPAVRANLTVAMGLAKPGHYLGAGREHAGLVLTADISLPRVLREPPPDAILRPGSNDLADLLPRRPLRAHKYSSGKVLVIGGSREYTGAPLLSARAALRGGAGAVVMAVPGSVRGTLARRISELLLLGLPETPRGALSAKALPVLAGRVGWADAIALGPGLTRDPEAMECVRGVLDAARCPVVLDADGLHALAGSPGLLRNRRGPTILTPHVGELAGLAGGEAREMEEDRLRAALIWARKTGCILVLKGSPTVTALPGGGAFMNSTGNPGMATIGSGDVLTGLIASLAAQGMRAESAAWGGVFVHGLAGDRAAGSVGRTGLTASDLVRFIPGALESVRAAASGR